MTIKQKTVNKASKSLLAKCMATEDIRVEHSKSAETAAFDIKNRCLILPVWKDMSNSMYDMLVAHEVSHALHTPFDQWISALEGISNKGAFKQICNVVEDARIERLIKQQYAGVRKDFARAYAELDKSDIFEIRGKNVADMNLIDRLNLHFKLGLFGLLQVPFSADEKVFVDRMENSKTFQDVLDIANDLYDDWSESLQDDEENQQQSQQSQDSGNNDQSDSGQSQPSDESDSADDGDDDGANGSESDSEGDEESDSAGSSDEDSDDSPSDSSESTDGAGDDDASQSQSATNQPNLDDIQGESDSSDESDDSSDEQSEQGEQDYDYDSYSEGDGALPSETQSAYDNAISEYTDTDGDDNEYFTLPESMNLDNIILDYKRVASMFDNQRSNILEDSNNADYYERKWNEANETTDKFLNGSKSVVNHMVNQFQMKQSADADRRTQISRSGVLDTTSMMNYRWSEDIFVKNESVSDGKNHGMVFFLDWSGSMAGILRDTVEQLLILTQFCQKTNIPFEVYAFSSNNILSYDDDGNYIDGFEQFTAKEGSTNPLKPHGFMLINFLSSRMNKAEYNLAVSRLHGCASGCRYMTPQGLGLSCTPLNEAIVSAMDIVPAFQEATGVQIVNAVFLTDGDGSSLGACVYGSDSRAVVHDPRTKGNFTVAKGHYRSETDTYLQILKDRTGCNLIGIRLHDNKNVHQLRYGYFNDNDMGNAVNNYKKSNFAEASDDRTGYDACYIIKGNIGTDEDALDSLGDGASYTQLRNAFRKNAGNAKTNKIIATKMIEVFASTLQK